MDGELWLLRHGDAEPHGTRPDAERGLTTRGGHQARIAGRAFVSLGLDFDAVFTSPRVRARDTARLVCETWGASPEVLPSLSEGFDIDDLVAVMSEVGAGSRVLLVGHEPDLSRTVHALTGARVALRKGGVAVVALRGGGGELLVLLRPRELEVIA